MSLFIWEGKTAKQLSCVDTAAAWGLGSWSEVWITTGCGWHRELGKWSKASMLIGSKFPSAIAVAIDRGISLIYN